MNIDRLNQQDLSELTALFCKCFHDDPYYAKLFPDGATRSQNMAEACRDAVSACLHRDMTLGIREQGKLIAFIICFDYKKIRDTDPETFCRIFTGTDSATLPYKHTLHSAVEKLPGQVIYCLSLAVDPAYRRCGLASALWDCMLGRFPKACFVSDVSNADSLAIYDRRRFTTRLLDEDYYMVTYIPGADAGTFAPDAPVQVVVPDVALLENSGIAYRLIKEKAAVAMAELETHCTCRCFVPVPDGVCFGALVSLSVEGFLQYQRAINVAHYEEILCGEYRYYLLHTPYTHFPLNNDTLDEMVQTRATEWGLIPDVYVSIPVQYDPAQLAGAAEAAADPRTRQLLHDMEFRTRYEAGIPSSCREVDDLASFKRRIRRRYLGKLQILITCESTVDQYDDTPTPIGQPISIDMFLSLDETSNCGVLTWYSLSAPFLISQLLDNVIRNQVAVVTVDGQVNLFDYLNSTYGIRRRGTPKSFVVVPKNKACLSHSQIASILASETIYPDGETYGEVIDPEITAAAQSEYGMGQYSRAYVAAYTNVVLQFNDELLQTLRDRIYEESITLFYIELILFEEAAINIADREINQLLTTAEVENPVDFLQNVEKIYDDYSKTIDFWAVQVNYPTSQKSIDMLRDAFKIKDKMEYMKRNQEQLQIVFDTKCDIVDRKDSTRMDKSLAILSILAIFSAWLDGHDYVSTWTDLLSENTVYIIQKVLFVLVLITAIYAVTHLFGRKLRTPKNKKRNPKKS